MRNFPFLSLPLLAGATRIGETGTGCGVGLAWLASGMRQPGAVAVSVERDPVRAAAAAQVFQGRPDITVLRGDRTAIAEHGPYDLLVLDGGGQGEGDGLPADPERLLLPGGVLVVDDFTPADTWPPLHEGRPDEARLHWLTHPALRTLEIPWPPTSRSWSRPGASPVSSRSPVRPVRPAARG